MICDIIVEDEIIRYKNVLHTFGQNGATFFAFQNKYIEIHHYLPFLWVFEMLIQRKLIFESMYIYGVYYTSPIYSVMYWPRPLNQLRNDSDATTVVASSDEEDIPHHDEWY